MSFQSNVIKILISSPSDVIKERNIAAEVIASWNTLFSTQLKVTLIPVMWENDSTVQSGEHPQNLLNTQLVRECDALIGIFWTKIGTPTQNAESGTLEEIDIMEKDEKLIMLYFSERKINPLNIDHNQYEKLKEFKKKRLKKGIIYTYNKIADFKHKLLKDLVTNVRSELIDRSQGREEPVEEHKKPKGPELKLIDSFPSDDQAITKEQLKEIFLKFNKPIAFDSTKYIGNYFVTRNTFCQWNICGWIQMADNDQKIIWHIDENTFSNIDNYIPDGVDYHTFEIHIGREPYEWKVKSQDGELFPQKVIKVKIDK